MGLPYTSYLYSIARFSVLSTIRRVVVDFLPPGRAFLPVVEGFRVQHRSVPVRAHGKVLDEFAVLFGSFPVGRVPKIPSIPLGFRKHFPRWGLDVYFDGIVCEIGIASCNGEFRF